jgi:hypothetical protein
MRMTGARKVLQASICAKANTDRALESSAEKSPVSLRRQGFFIWWWGGTPHQATIEGTQSKHCGLLRTSANSIEKPARLLTFKQVFQPCWSPETGSKLVGDWMSVQFPNPESNPRPHGGSY